MELMNSKDSEAANLRDAGDFSSSFPNREATIEQGLEGGFIPKGHLVLVLPDQIPEKSAGGIALPGEIIERDYLSQIIARVVDFGPMAWMDEPEARAEPGDLVMIAKFSGQLFRGADGLRYRLINDKDVLGVIIKEGVKL